MLALLLIAGPCGCAPQEETRILSRDGGWCWFQDPRAVVHAGMLVLGTVADGRGDPGRRGDIEALVHDLATGATTRVELHDRLEADDHDAPVFLLRPDGRLLAAWARHGPENRFYVRISEPGDPTRWGPLRTVVPTPTSRITYTNLFRLPEENGRIYNFFRGLDGRGKPSYATSDDGGKTWAAGGVFIGSKAVRPYARYATDGRRDIHVVYTEGHPRDADNSLYHVILRGGILHRSDGTPIRPLAEGLSVPEEGTRIFAGSPDAVAWPCDVEIDASGRPVVAYSVQVGSAGLPPGQGGDDLRYRIARWTGGEWADTALGFAGTRLYAREDDYSGLAALDPRSPTTVYVSTNADPATGAPLKSAADGRRHWEIFRADTRDEGRTWTWSAVTKDSTVDNLRPLVPAAPEGVSVLAWLRGTYHSYTRYDLEVVAQIRTANR